MLPKTHTTLRANQSGVTPVGINHVNHLNYLQKPGLKRQKLTHSSVLANTEDSRNKLKTVHTERPFAVPSVMHLSVYQLLRVELYTKINNKTIKLQKKTQYYTYYPKVVGHTDVLSGTFSEARQQFRLDAFQTLPMTDMNETENKNTQNFSKKFRAASTKCQITHNKTKPQHTIMLRFSATMFGLRQRKLSRQTSSGHDDHFIVTCITLSSSFSGHSENTHPPDIST